MRLKAAAVVPVIAGCLALAPIALAADSTRTLKVELSASALSHFAVENLAGAMKIVPSDVKTVTAIATVHAESDELAAQMKLEQVTAKNLVQTLRVRYPLEDNPVIRYHDHESNVLSSMFGGSSTNTEYDGYHVKVVERGGVLLYADVEVQVPRHLDDAVFKNVVGSMQSNGLDGKVKFDTGSGDVTIASMKGEIITDTGSGDVKATEVSGSFNCDTGSGNCDLIGFDGDKIKCDVGSGDVTLRDVVARHVDLDSGSGDLRVTGDVEDFSADTGSGNVRLEDSGTRLAHITADTGSGDVVLRLSPDATFEALADQGSGDITMKYKDATAIVRHKEILGYRRGDAKVKIDVDTGSGDLTIEPGA